MWKPYEGKYQTGGIQRGMTSFVIIIGRHTSSFSSHLSLLSTIPSCLPRFFFPFSSFVRPIVVFLPISSISYHLCLFPSETWCHRRTGIKKPRAMRLLPSKAWAISGSIQRLGHKFKGSDLYRPNEERITDGVEGLGKTTETSARKSTASKFERSQYEAGLVTVHHRLLVAVKEEHNSFVIEEIWRTNIKFWKINLSEGDELVGPKRKYQDKMTFSRRWIDWC